MEIIIVILLAVIAYMLWRIFRQKEDELQAIADEKFDAEWEAKKNEEFKEKFKDFPHLVENIDDSYLEIYSSRKELNLKQAWMSYVSIANNTNPGIDEADYLFHSLWDLTEELLEHLEKYHKSSKYEYEIAINNYWRIIVGQEDSLVGKDIETIQIMFRSTPFTDIQKIASWFPKKDNHKNEEISFEDEKGNFPRKSKGSTIIQDRLKELGL